MIENKKDLLYYLEQDRLALHIKEEKFNKENTIWYYQRTLRYLEYYKNKEKKSIFDKILYKKYKKKYKKMCDIYTTHIPVNSCGPGLSIAHLGGIYINGKARIGKNLRIQTGVVIGGAAGKPIEMEIADNVYLGSGCKVIGNVKIAQGVAIGANAVVTKSIEEENTTWAGVPAKKISNNNSYAYIDKRVLEE